MNRTKTTTVTILNWMGETHKVADLPQNTTGFQKTNAESCSMKNNNPDIDILGFKFKAESQLSKAIGH